MANRSNRHKDIPKNSSYVDMDQSLEWNKICVSRLDFHYGANTQTGLINIEGFSAVFNFSSSVNQETGIIIISFYTGGSEVERNLFKVIQGVYNRTEEIRNF